MDKQTTLYDDGRIECDDQGITLRWYYPWGSKRIRYRTIRGVQKMALSPVRGKWRIWGSGDFVHWYNLDTTRPGKNTAIELDVGTRIRPRITPDAPETVARILTEHLA